MIYNHGDFSFIKNDLERETLEHDFNVISQKELWEYFKNHDSSKPFFLDINLINYNWYPGHSSCSHALSMRKMEYITKYGWDKFVDTYH